MIAATVHIIDDDPALSSAIACTLQTYGYSVQMHRSTSEFMSRQLPGGAACLILDLKLPGIAGLDLQGVLAVGREHLPIIFVSGQDVISARRPETETHDVLWKPLRERELLSAIDAALTRSLTARVEREALEKDQEAFATLTPRERQVCVLIARGLLNKQVGFELGTSEKTVKAQRAKVLHKLRAGSLADLVRSVERLRAAGIISHFEGTGSPPIQEAHESLSTFFRSPVRDSKHQHRSVA